MTGIILPGGSESQRRRAIGALYDPHDARERFEPDFVLMWHCSRCDGFGDAPRKLMREAIKAHVEEDCPARHSAADDPIVIRVLYPKQ